MCQAAVKKAQGVLRHAQNAHEVAVGLAKGKAKDRVPTGELPALYGAASASARPSMVALTTDKVGDPFSRLASLNAATRVESRSNFLLR